jgi:hypothetical protein
MNNTRVKASSVGGSKGGIVVDGNKYLTQLITMSKNSHPTIGKIERSLDQLYISRNTSGKQRTIFNEKVPVFKGAYNRDGFFEIQPRDVHRFEIFNLTA